MAMPTISIVSDSNDGYIQGSAAIVYNTARNTSTSSDDTGTEMLCGQAIVTTTYTVNRDYLRFYVGSIVGTITGYTLSMTLTSDESATDFNIIIRPYNWTPTLSANREANYDGLLAASNTNDVVLRSTAGIAIETRYTSGALTVTPSSGYVYLGLLSSRDISATSPTGLERVTFATSTHATSTFRPTLNVTYTAASTRTSGGINRTRAAYLNASRGRGIHPSSGRI